MCTIHLNGSKQQIPWTSRQVALSQVCEVLLATPTLWRFAIWEELCKSRMFDSEQSRCQIYSAVVLDTATATRPFVKFRKKDLRGFSKGERKLLWWLRYYWRALREENT